MFVLAAVLQATSSGFDRFIGGIPHDAASIFIYIFLAVSLYLVWRGSRTRA